MLKQMRVQEVEWGEGDEEVTFRLWDLYEDIGLWSSDMPHLDAADVWEAMDNMNRHNVPKSVQEKMLGGNARRLYGIEPELVVTRAPDDYTPVTLSRFASQDTGSTLSNRVSMVAAGRTPEPFFVAIEWRRLM